MWSSSRLLYAKDLELVLECSLPLVTRESGLEEIVVCCVISLVILFKLLYHDKKGLISRRAKGLISQFCHCRVPMKLPPAQNPALDSLGDNTCVSSLGRMLAHTKNNRDCSPRAHVQGTLLV